LGGGVTTQTAAGTKTGGDSPNGARLSPQLRKAASAMYATGIVTGVFCFVTGMYFIKKDDKN